MRTLLIALAIIACAYIAQAQSTTIVLPGYYTEYPGGYYQPNARSTYDQTTTIVVPRMPSGGVVFQPSTPDGMTFGYGNEGERVVIVPTGNGGFFIIEK